MRAGTFSFTDAEGLAIVASRWLPDTEVRAVVQIIHGMAEHAGRYERFALALTDRGFAVYADDLRGHGRTAGDVSRLGILAKKGGFRWLVRDEQQLTGLVKSENSGKPIMLFGHSMGTAVARGLMSLSGHEYAGVILSGLTYPGNALLWSAWALASAEAAMRGRERQSRFLTWLSFGSYNRPFRPNRTGFDWLSRDAGEVDRYVADPYCGGTFSAGFYRDLFGGLAWAKRRSVLAGIPRNLPVYLFSGAVDPVGARGKGVLQLAALYRKLGLRDVTCKLYPEGRHEMLNDINREDVTRDTIAWIERHLT
jgi:alpha-beta hydrolase superfamily lysophospholipase